MKLFYFQRRDGLSNFGDQLNTWLWPQLLPGVFDEDETTAFLGFGTLLNNLLPQRIPKAKKVIIFSTGAGYHQALKSLNPNWKIYCVRGQLSAQILSISPDLAVTDGAVLVRRLWQPSQPKRYRFSWMPHVHHATSSDIIWKEICTQIGFHYIDPRWPVNDVLSAISQTEILLAEAMHGAVVADALRVPWVPIITSAKILKFKWQDWCSSMGINYRPYYLLPLFNSYRRYARGLRSSQRAFIHLSQSILQYPPFGLLWQNQVQLCGKQLLKIAQTAQPQLSATDRIEELTDKLEQRLDQFKQDEL